MGSIKKIDLVPTYQNISFSAMSKFLLVKEGVILDHLDRLTTRYAESKFGYKYITISNKDLSLNYFEKDMKNKSNESEVL